MTHFDLSFSQFASCHSLVVSLSPFISDIEHALQQKRLTEATDDDVSVSNDDPDDDRDGDQHDDDQSNGDKHVDDDTGDGDEDSDDSHTKTHSDDDESIGNDDSGAARFYNIHGTVSIKKKVYTCSKQNTQKPGGLRLGSG